MAFEQFLVQGAVGKNAPPTTIFSSPQHVSDTSEIVTQYPMAGSKKLVRTRALVVSNTLLPGKSLTWVYRKDGIDTPVSLTVLDSDAAGTVLVVNSSLVFPDKSLVNLLVSLFAGDPVVTQSVVLNWTWEFSP